MEIPYATIESAVGPSRPPPLVILRFARWLGLLMLRKNTKLVLIVSSKRTLKSLCIFLLNAPHHGLCNHEVLDELGAFVSDEWNQVLTTEHHDSFVNFVNLGWIRERGAWGHSFLSKKTLGVALSMSSWWRRSPCEPDDSIWDVWALYFHCGVHEKKSKNSTILNRYHIEKSPNRPSKSLTFWMCKATKHWTIAIIDVSDVTWVVRNI